MSTHPEQTGAHGEEHRVRAEPDAINTPAILSVGIGALVVFFIASLVAVSYLRFREARHVPPPLPVELGQNKIGMVEQQLFDLAVRGEQQRAAKLQQLGSYGWVDRQAGIARIPIDEAMSMVASGVRPGVVPPEGASAPGAQP